MATSWHLTSLTVLGGTLHGKKLTVEDVVVEVLIGSDSDCHLHLDLPSVSPIHARLWIEPDDVTVYGTKSGPGVFVNFDRIEVDGKLRPGDLLWLGPPQQAGSVMLQVHFEERDTLPPVAVSPLDVDDAEVESAEPLALEISALTEPVAPREPAPDEPLVASAAPRAPEATPTADAREEPLGVLPEEPAIGGEPPRAEFDEFVIMESPASAAAPVQAAVEEFVVSGFEAEWPASDATKAALPTAPSQAPATASDDVFFVDVGATAPPPPVVSQRSDSDDSFFIDDVSLGTSGITAPAPPPQVPAAELADLSFAEAFHEASASPAISSAPAPASPLAAPPPVAKPPVAKPPAGPSSSPPTPLASVPPPAKVSAAPPSGGEPQAAPAPRAPSATSAVRPLSRPDVSQSVSRGDRPPRPDRTQAVRPRRPAARPPRRYAVVGAIALVVIGGTWFAVSKLMHRVHLDRIDPQRARVGETVALQGRGFSSSPGDNVVLFDDRTASITTATPTRLEVVVPDVAEAGADVRAAVRVKVGSTESMPVEVSVYSGPVLHGISPDVAMPGEEVVLAGSGWGLAPTVRFGGLPADVLEAKETSVRVRVPAIDGGPGTAAPVVVISGSLESNPGPFYVGRIPLVTKAEPTRVSPGDVVTVGGRGFRRERSQNAVQIGGVRALVVAAFDDEIKVVVPRVPAGSRMLEVRVPSSVAPAQVPLVVGGALDTVAFRFVAEPFAALPGRDHAVLATALGPAFVVASSGGRAAAERALEAARRLNDAAQALRASTDLTFALRDADGTLSLSLAGRPELILEVTDEDASAYGEDWTGLRGRGGPVTPGRLGRWWEAVAKDLVLLLVRGTKPHFAADLAPEGRALIDLFQAAQRPGGRAKPADGLKLVALRVPPSVRGPATSAPVAVASPTALAATPPPRAAVPMPRLEGPWSGSETEGGRRRDVTVTFRGSTGTFAYEGVMTVSAPLLTVTKPQRGAARFSVEFRGGLRYYLGRWDGRALTGKVSTDPGGSQSLGTFELRPR